MKKKTISIAIAVIFTLLVTAVAFAGTKTVVSDTSVMAYGPLFVEPEGLDDPDWGVSSPAVISYVHSSWPGISGANYISTSYHVEFPYSADSWRKFSKTIELCEGAYNIHGEIMHNADNAEAVYVNGEFLTSDGEVTGPYTDNHEWNTVLTKYYATDSDTLSFDFIVRNYPGTNSQTGNPTGLIFSATVNYDCNQPPTVNAGGPYSGDLLSPISIVGTAEDPDGDVLTFKWSSNNSACTIADPTALETTVACTDVGTYTFTLEASDGMAQATDTAVVYVVDPYLTTGISNCSYGEYPGYTYVETKFVSSVGSGDVTPVVPSSAELKPGVHYKLEASGVFYAGGDYKYDIRADAKYTQDGYQRANSEGWTDLLRGYETTQTGLLELHVDGNLVEWGGFASDHVYTHDKVGSGSPLEFQFHIYDTYAQNNTGGLCVSLFEKNEPPVADPNGPYLVAVDTPLTFDGSGSFDLNGDALTYAWDFGDGNTGTGATPSHSYATAGIYDVCLTVNDGIVDSAEVCTLAVVYDPSAGFVTGGGWIYSAPRAYKPDPGLEGKATFGFVAKYKKGATTPDGNTEFQFKAGDLNFHSTSYDWLVVTGGDTAKFKGVGTINGSGEYKFQIWANDGSPDFFGIKIWTEDDFGNETVIYDNGFQEIGGGSIVVHSK